MACGMLSFCDSQLVLEANRILFLFFRHLKFVAGYVVPIGEARLTVAVGLKD